MSVRTSAHGHTLASVSLVSRLALGALTLVACGGGDMASGGAGGSGCGENAAAYDGAAHSTHAATQLDVKARALGIADQMKAATADPASGLTAAALVVEWEAGSPALTTLVTPFHDGYTRDLFAKFEAADDQSWTPAAPPSGPGGVLGEDLFDAEGVDLRQAYEKTLFGAVFTKVAWELSAAPLTEASLDALLALYGADPSFPGDSSAGAPSSSPTPDKLIAQYAERRSPKDPSDASKPLDPAEPGPYFRIRQGFIEAQAALRAGGETCQAKAEEAVTNLLAEWEPVLASTAVFYLYEASELLTKDGATDADLAEGLHAYNEAVSFLRGFRTLEAGERQLDDAALDSLLTLLMQAPGQGATAYELVTDSAAAAPRLLEAVDQLAQAYGWTAEDIEAFRVSH